LAYSREEVVDPGDSLPGLSWGETPGALLPAVDLIVLLELRGLPIDV
jgi:hypothetical protein